MIPVQAPQYRQYALISDFLDLAHLSVREEAALATNWIKDRLEGLKLQNLSLATMTRDFSPHLAVLRRHLLPNVHFQCSMLLQGTLGGDFDIFAAKR